MSSSKMDWMHGVAVASLLSLSSALVGCGGGSQEELADVIDLDQDCSGECGTLASESLSVADVQDVIARGVAEAQARGVQATIAVTDRVGNVLGVFRMGLPQERAMLVSTGTAADGSQLINAGLEGLTLPVTPFPFSGANIDHLGAIAKAITGAFLSSEGNAFTTRTANQIVQDHFNPGEINQPAGPLFGVQFSQLACSDFSGRFTGNDSEPGPQRSPLGLSADPGGLPLYKNGVPVGGVGVIADGLYSVDASISDVDQDVDCLLYTSPSPRDRTRSRMPSSA